jgi:hypothetical protein
MSSVPFYKAGFLCAAAFLLSPVATLADVVTVSQKIDLGSLLPYRLPSTNFSLPDFNSALGTLEKVELTIKISPRRTVTIYNSANPSEDFVNLTLTPPGGAKVSGTDLADFQGAGELGAHFTKGNIPISKMGWVGELLYCTGTPRPTKAIMVDYTFITNTQAAPEPAGKYLSALAAGAMLLLLIGREMRRRA